MKSEQNAFLQDLYIKRKQLVEQQKWEEALEIAKLMKDMQFSAENLYEQGDIEMSMQLYSQAINSFKQALQLAPDLQIMTKAIEKMQNCLNEKDRGEHFEINVEAERTNHIDEDSFTIEDSMHGISAISDEELAKSSPRSIIEEDSFTIEDSMHGIPAITEESLQNNGTSQEDSFTLEDSVHGIKAIGDEALSHASQTEEDSFTLQDSMHEIAAVDTKYLPQDTNKTEIIFEGKSVAHDDSLLPTDRTVFLDNKDDDILQEDSYVDLSQLENLRYRLIRELGIGGMGKVYLAEDRQLKRSVALKTVLMSEDPKIIKRFIREAETLAKLSHPNIVNIYGLEKWQDNYFFTMDYIEGVTLQEYAQNNPLQEKKALQIIRKVALAIDYAHGEGILHRDLKPANIMINSNDKPVVMDFGLAMIRESSGDTNLSKSGDIIGTPAYISPEQVSGKKHNIDERSDVYSLGTILYHLLTGQAPFIGPEHKIISLVQTKDPVSPHKINRKISEAAENICLKAIAKEKSRRYQSAYELAKDIERLLKGQEVLALPPSNMYRLRRWISQNKLLTCLFVVFLLACFALFFWSYFKIRLEISLANSALKVAQVQEQKLQRALLVHQQTIQKIEHTREKILVLLSKAEQERNSILDAKQKAMDALEKAKEQKLKTEQQKQKTAEVEQKILRSLIVALESNKLQDRQEAVTKIISYKEKAEIAIPALIGLLEQNQNRELQDLAQKSLVSIGSACITPLLQSRLPKKLRFLLIETISKDNISGLILALRNTENEQQKKILLLALSRIPPENTPKIIHLSADHSEIHQDILKVLKHIGDPAVPVLLDYLEKTDNKQQILIDAFLQRMNKLELISTCIALSNDFTEQQQPQRFRQDQIETIYVLTKFRNLYFPKSKVEFRLAIRGRLGKQEFQSDPKSYYIYPKEEYKIATTTWRGSIGKWVLGNYHLEIEVDGKVVDKIMFSIIK